jgi:dTDP-4-dehydrorhamnose reductase
MVHAILGATGQLAGELATVLPDAVALSRNEADLTQPETLRAALERVQPDVVFNCAAYNFVDRAENEPGAAFAVNAVGVRDLALVCRELACVLVHFSTDYVFGLNEARQTPYAEDEAPGPVSIYGTSKLAGEYMVRTLCPKHFIIRTCGLYGHRGRGGKGGNFVQKMLRLAEEGKTLRVVADQRCTPSYTADVAAVAVALVESGKYGLYHGTNAGDCTWYEFAKEIFSIRSMAASLTPVTTIDFGAVARRPHYSVLSTAAIQGLGLRPVRPWQEALGEYLENSVKNSIDATSGAGKLD